MSKNTSLDQFKQVAILRNHLRSTCEVLGLDLDHLWPRLRKITFPSEYIQSQLRWARKDAPRAKGSDLGDAYLACFAPYLDAIVVDKRTYEYLNQCSRRDNEFKELIGLYIKASSYHDLVDTLCNKQPERN